MKYLCDHTINSVNTPEKSTHFLNKRLGYNAAYTQCADKADGRDFAAELDLGFGNCLFLETNE